MTSESRPLSIDKIVNKYLLHPAETVEDGSSGEDEVPDEPISLPLQNDVDEVIEMQNRLTRLSRFLTSESLK